MTGSISATVWGLSKPPSYADFHECERHIAQKATELGIDDKESDWAAENSESQCSVLLRRCQSRPVFNV
jgi:hypothetical protein